MITERDALQRLFAAMQTHPEETRATFARFWPNEVRNLDRYARNPSCDCRYDILEAWEDNPLGFSRFTETAFGDSVRADSN
jgi:hypothetical protein